MKIRNLTIEDTEKIYQLFKASSISREEALAKNPSSGFYEYPLSPDDIAARLQDPAFSLCLERQGKILAYIIAYPINFLKTALLPRNPEDSVFNRLQEAAPSAIYLDQSWMNPGLPAFMFGRIMDTFEDMVKAESSPGVLVTIPQFPWTNRSSTRLALHRGLRRSDTIRIERLEGEERTETGLGLFSKVYYKLDSPFNSYRDNRILDLHQ